MNQNSGSAAPEFWLRQPKVWLRFVIDTIAKAPLVTSIDGLVLRAQVACLPAVNLGVQLLPGELSLNNWSLNHGKKLAGYIVHMGINV